MRSADHDTARALVEEGWSHLRLQRPIAAWASWRRALGYDADLPEVRQALAGLERAPDLPAAARTPLRFQPPDTPERRTRWDELLRSRNLEDLADAAEAFATLAREDPDDASAWYNSAVTLAWQGRNVEAVQALDRVVSLWSESRFDDAVAAWILTDVLRQGAGAEVIADDLAHAWIIHVDDEVADEMLSAWSERLQPVPPPVDPATGQSQHPDSKAYTWLDRPVISSRVGEPRLSDLPLVLAQFLCLPGVLRLSSPDPDSLERAFTDLMTTFGDQIAPTRRESTPLPLPLLDAAVWTFRVPPGLDPEREVSLAREAVEQYFEGRWLHTPRHGLDGRTPLEAARASKAGDRVARAKLTAIVRFREQLGQRAWTAELYHGYPFDRLRRRLGLDVVDPAASDPNDLSCMSEEELAELDAATLNDEDLAEAYLSAAMLRNDRLAARFAAELARRDAPTLARLDTPSLIATLVREAMKDDHSGEALDWLDQARAINRGRNRPLYDVWTAEIYARTGAPGAAVQAYQELLDRDPGNAALALDAAETLLDNGYAEHARPLLLQARDRARNASDPEIERRVDSLMHELPPSR